MITQIFKCATLRMIGKYYIHFAILLLNECLEQIKCDNREANAATR